MVIKAVKFYQCCKAPVPKTVRSSKDSVVSDLEKHWKKFKFHFFEKKKIKMTVHFKFWQWNVINNFDNSNGSAREINIRLFHISIWDKLDR